MVTSLLGEASFMALRILAPTLQIPIGEKLKLRKKIAVKYVVVLYREILDWHETLMYTFDWTIICEGIIISNVYPLYNVKYVIGR